MKQNILAENMRRFKTMNLNEQGPTPAPKPNFEPGQLTDPNFMADWTNYSLSDGAKQTRYKDFMKRQQDLLDDAKKEYDRARGEMRPGSVTKGRVFGDYYALKGWFSSIFNFMGTAGVTLPKNYIEYVSNEIELGKDPKTLEELWPYIKQNISPKKNDLKTLNIALEKAILKVKNND
jgi:hypothetical protein